LSLGRTVYETSDFKYAVTLKTGLGFRQGFFSRPCYGVAMLRRVINWRISSSYYY